MTNGAISLASLDCLYGLSRTVLNSSGTEAVIRVSALGAILFAVTPYFPRSFPTTLVKPAIPDFAAP